MICRPTFSCRKEKKKKRDFLTFHCTCDKKSYDFHFGILVLRQENFIFFDVKGGVFVLAMKDDFTILIEKGKTCDFLSLLQYKYNKKKENKNASDIKRDNADTFGLADASYVWAPSTFF